MLADWDPQREGFFWRGPTALDAVQHFASRRNSPRRVEIIYRVWPRKTGRNERAGNLSGGQKRLVEFARIRDGRASSCDP